MTKYNFTQISGNRKIGPIPIITTDRDTCWKGCPFHGKCYGNGWPISKHWNDLSTGKKPGCSLTELCRKIKTLPLGMPFRFADVGDLPGKDGRIDITALRAIVKASQGKHGFCYTHKPLTKRNVEIIKELSCDSFCINASCEGLVKADAISDLALPLVTVVSKDLPEDWRCIHTPAGHKVMRCPATWLVRNGQKVQCATCGGSKGPMCNWKDRDFIIGFDPHGFTNKIEEACNAEQERFEKTGKLY